MQGLSADTQGTPTHFVLQVFVEKLLVKDVEIGTATLSLDQVSTTQHCSSALPHLV